MLIVRMATDSWPYIYLFFHCLLKARMMLPSRKLTGCRSEQMDATKPVNCADQMKVKISAKFMQVQLTGVVPHLLPPCQTLSWSHRNLSYTFQLVHPLFIPTVYIECFRRHKRCFMDNTAPTIRHLQPCMNCRRAQCVTLKIVQAFQAKQRLVQTYRVTEWLKGSWQFLAWLANWINCELEPAPV